MNKFLDFSGMFLKYLGVIVLEAGIIAGIVYLTADYFLVYAHHLDHGKMIVWLCTGISGILAAITGATCHIIIDVRQCAIIVAKTK